MRPHIPWVGWDGGIRTHVCQSQSLVPYRLATSHRQGEAEGGPERTPRPSRLEVIWGGRWDSNPRSSEPQSDALTNYATPTIGLNGLSFFGTPEGTRTPGLLLRRQLLYPAELLARMERVMGIEPTRPAWKAGILPLNYTRTGASISQMSAWVCYHRMQELSMGSSDFSGISFSRFRQLYIDM